MGVYYEVTTCHETRLVVHVETGTISHSIERTFGADFLPIIAFVPQKGRGLCFLLPTSPVAETLKIPGADFGKEIAPLRTTPVDEAGNVSFYNPSPGSNLAAVPSEEGSVVGLVVTGRAGTSDWELFKFREISPLYVAASPKSAGDRLDKVLHDGLQVKALMRLLHDESTGVDWVPVIEAVTRLMAQEQLDYFAQWLAGAPRALQRLGEIYRDDIDATTALPRLIEWLASRATADREGEPRRPSERVGFWARLGFRRAQRRTAAIEPKTIPRAKDKTIPRPEELGTNLDFVGSRGHWGFYVSFPHACNALLRQSVRPLRDVCVIATARNEGLYLVEWIAYHRAIGVESFFLYSNDNSDGSDELLAALARTGFINWFPSEIAAGRNAQAKVYGHALGLLPDPLDYRWALIMDLDEFFVFHPNMFGTIVDYIAWQEVQPVDAIALNWVVFGSGGQVQWRDEPVTRRFTSHGGPGPLIKTLFRPRKFIHSTPHYPNPYGQTPFVFRNSDRGLHPYHDAEDPSVSEAPLAYHAWINHYFYKSAEEYLWKWARGRVSKVVGGLTNENLTKNFVTQFVEQQSRTKYRISDTIQKCAPNLSTEMEHLLSFSDVAQALEVVKQNYRLRIRDLVKSFESAPGIVEAEEAGTEFLNILRGGSEGSSPRHNAVQVAEPSRNHELPADFDEQLYLRANPDVARARLDPIWHYLNFGKAEGRRLKPLRSP
jgi:hypothetical protein